MAELAPVPDTQKASGVGISAPEALGAPTTETASRTLTLADLGRSLITPSAITFSVPPGQIAGFGTAAFGAGVVSFVGAPAVIAGVVVPAPVITDCRTTGSTNPSCALVQTATTILGAAVDAYSIYGSKA